MSHREIADFIRKGDIESLRKLDFDPTVPFSNATCEGKITEVIKYLADERKAIPNSDAVFYAFVYGNIDMFLYLVKIAKRPIEIYRVFNRIDRLHLNKDCVLKLANVTPSQLQAFESTLNVKLLEDTNINLAMKLLVALCTSLHYTITNNDIHSMITKNRFGKFLKEHFVFLLNNIKVEPLSVENAGFIYCTDLDVSTLRGMSMHFTTPLVNDIITNIPFVTYGDDTVIISRCINNMLTHIDTYGIVLDDNFPFEFMETNFNLVLAKITLDQNRWLLWLGYCIQHRLLYHFTCLLNYKQDYLDSTEIDKQRLFKYALIKDRDFVPLLLEKYCPSKDGHWLKWLDVVKLLGASDSDDLKTVVQKYKDLLPMIDFETGFPIVKKEEWIWFGISSIYDNRGSTYHSIPYEHKIPILEEFKNIINLKDVKSNLSKLKRIHSPTGCYFNIGGEVFYHDSQGCILWALDEKGRVYIHDPDNAFSIQLVAASLPEFLSRIKWECTTFFSSH